MSARYVSPGRTACAISTAMGRGEPFPPTAPSGSRPRCSPVGPRTRRDPGRSILPTAGPGSTPRRGVGRPITMGAGSP
jgi:hypothetical protein